jgi:hypothetical protein
VSAVAFDPRVPDLRAPAQVVSWLATGEPEGPMPEAEALAEAGAVRDGALHPALEAIREITGAPLFRLTLERGNRIGHGWFAAGRVVLAHPVDDGLARLTSFSAAFLLDALARLNDVGPRPRVEPAVRIGLEPGALARALAERSPLPAGIADPDAAAAFAGLIGGLREHWRVTVAWDPADGALGGRRLEVIDTNGGYWLVIPDDPTVELWPTTPTRVYRALCDLFPTSAEVRTWQTT